MGPSDLYSVASILARATMVCPMEEVHNGRVDPLVVAMRHDVDNADNAFRAARALANWEAARGYRSTYFFLHTAKYWGPGMIDGLREIASLGHEIGFHNDALGAWVGPHGKDLLPHTRIERDVEDLRRWSGERVCGTAAHGNRALTKMGHRNYQIFTEATFGNNVKPLSELGFKPLPLADFGFTYQAEFLPAPYRLVDSGGSFAQYANMSRGILTLDAAEEGFPFDGQLSMNLHPDHWPEALFS